MVAAIVVLGIQNRLVYSLVAHMQHVYIHTHTREEKSLNFDSKSVIVLFCLDWKDMSERLVPCH